MVKISESGIGRAEDAVLLRGAGYQGFLIGESFMRHPAPEQACAKFIQDLEAQLSKGSPS
jgi:indole-3-glycerol phosphate synthase